MFNVSTMCYVSQGVSLDCIRLHLGLVRDNGPPPC
jgi:hypothetical protein